MKYIISIILLFTVMVSCQKEEFGTEQNLQQNVALKQQTNATATVQAAAASTFTEYQVSPKFGKPNTTTYYFQVLDLNGTFALSIKLYERATGVTTYYAMTRVGNYWTRSLTLPQNGWYDYRYVYTATQQPINTATSYELCNTRTVFNAGSFSSVRWIFGADGSSYTNRLGWKGPRDAGGCGNGWEAPGSQHFYLNCSVDDRFAEDWNRDCLNSGGSADDGAELRSPFDGTVLFAGNSTGYGNRVDIQQTLANGSNIVFRIAHLKYTPTVTVGAWVKAGVTKIGNLGSTGNSTGPHAHCAMYSINGGCYSAEKFNFDAQ